MVAGMSQTQSLLAGIKATRKPATVTLPIVLDGELVARYNAAKKAFTDAVKADAESSARGLADAPLKPAAEAALKAMAEEVDGSEWSFLFQAMHREELEAIKAEHPPTNEQLERFRDMFRINPMVSAPEFNPDDAAPAIIAGAFVSAVAPNGDEWESLTVEEAKAIYDELSDGEAARLFDAAWSVNQQVTLRPTSAAASA